MVHCTQPLPLQQLHLQWCACRLQVCTCISVGRLASCKWAVPGLKYHSSYRGAEPLHALPCDRAFSCKRDFVCQGPAVQGYVSLDRSSAVLWADRCFRNDSLQHAPARRRGTKLFGIMSEVVGPLLCMLRACARTQIIPLNSNMVLRKSWLASHPDDSAPIRVVWMFLQPVRSGAL